MGLFFNPRVLFYGLCRDSRRHLGRVLLLHIGGRGGDGSPCFA